MYDKHSTPHLMSCTSSRRASKMTHQSAGTAMSSLSSARWMQAHAMHSERKRRNTFVRSPSFM